MTDTVTHKAEKMLEARERHYKEVEDKQKMQLYRQMQEERLRIRNLSQKQESHRRKEMTIDVLRHRNKVLLLLTVGVQRLHPEQGTGRVPATHRKLPKRHKRKTPQSRCHPQCK